MQDKHYKADFNLWFIGNAYHAMEQTKSNIKNNFIDNAFTLGDETSRRLAEYFLDKMSFDNLQHRNMMRLSGKSQTVLSYVNSDEIERVHAAESEYIRGKWTPPPMSDTEAFAALVPKEITELLEDNHPIVREIFLNL